MIEEQLVFRFTHDSVEYNIATASFMFVESGNWKTANGVIAGDKPLSLTKEMGLFLWGNQSEYQFSDLWILNQSQSINNTAGNYDDLLDIPRDTAVEIYVAGIDSNGESDYSDWTKVGEYHVDRSRNSGDNYIVISLLSKLVLMEKNTEHQYFSDTLVYVNNREQARPICLGPAFNVPGVLIDDTTNEYEFHDENTISNVIYAYDDYDVFTEGVDFTEGSLSTGGYGINLSSPAAGKITGYVNGAIYSAAATNKLKAYILKLLTSYASISLSDIDTSSLDDIETDWDGRYAVYINQPTNVREIVEITNRVHCGYTYINSTGQIAFGYLDLPTGTATYEFEEYYISSEGVDIDPDGAPGLSDGVASERNWHVFTDGDVAGSVSQSDKDKVTQQYQTYYRSTTTTGGGNAFDDFYAHARNGCFISTYCSNAVKAEDLITHVEVLYDEKRNLYTCEIIVTSLLTAMLLNIGDEIKITWPRWGLAAGKNIIIKNIQYNDLMKRKIKIIGWA